MKWWTNWMGTKLHAVRDGDGVNCRTRNMRAWPICRSGEVYKNPCHDIAERNIRVKEAPRCKRCLEIIEREADRAGGEGS